MNKYIEILKHHIGCINTALMCDDFLTTDEKAEWTIKLNKCNALLKRLEKRI